MNQLPIDFIHIGLGKCASTYLQTVFNNEPDYNIIDLKGVVESVHENARRGADPKQFPNVNINIDRSAIIEDKKFTIASNEDFTFISQPKHYEYIKHLHGLSAHFLGKAQISSNILLIIRNPIEWLRAAHEQSIKGGEFGSYSDFFKKEKNYLKHSLDIKKIIRVYSNFFNIVTLAVENLKEEPDGFWMLFSEQLGVKPPKKELLDQVLKNKISTNSSLKDRSIKLAALNRFSAIKLECLQALGDYNIYMAEESEANILYCEHERWSNRRIAEFASDMHLNKLVAQLHESGSKKFSHVYIDKDMKDHLLKHFIEPIKNIASIPDKLKKTYIKSIKEAAI